MIRRLFVAAFAVSFACVLACSGNRTEGMEQSKLPDNLRDDYAMFARKCSKCHSLARPLNATVESDQQWVNYVNRMRRQPGSAISPEDTVPVLRFLHWYSFEAKNPVLPVLPAPSASAAVADGGAP